jgi:hypothetical protein
MATYQQIKNAYVEVYGHFYNTDEYDSFDEAFQSALDYSDYVKKEKDEYEIAEAMTCLPQLTQY